MALFSNPSLLGTLALLGLALCLLAVGWAWARKAGLGALASTLAASDVARPAQLGPYTLADKIGAGAMGEVYRAYHSVLGTWRAVKLLPAGASQRERQRFEKEARLGGELSHPNTVSIYDRGEGQDGTCYYAMELLDGVNLHQLVEREGPQSPERAVAILLQLCAALEEAHDKGLIHRDVKPDNVLITADGSVKLIDFGLVERVGEVALGQSVGAVVGTPLYISPEAIVAPETVGAHSDLYGLGAVAYFLLTGAPVFRGRSVVEVCGHHLHTSPERLSSVLGAAIPEGLEQLVLDCLAKEAAQRPGSAAEVAQRLTHCFDDLPPRVAAARSGVESGPRAIVASEGSTVDALAHTLPGEAFAPPLCLAVMRAQRAFERLDAFLAAGAQTGACRRAA
jgi:serine/threonine protein kinase